MQHVFNPIKVKAGPVRATNHAIKT